MSFFDQDLADAAADAAMDAYDDRPTAAELRAESLAWTGWSPARRALVVEEYDRDRGDF